MPRDVIRDRIENYSNGWIVGNFAPALAHSVEVEVAIKHLKAGDREPEHFQRQAVEITIVIHGSCRLNGEVLSAGDVLRIPANVSGDFVALSDVVLLVIKTPSLPGDKVVGKAITIVE